jgi:hypothetical protein
MNTHWSTRPLLLVALASATASCAVRYIPAEGAKAEPKEHGGGAGEQGEVVQLGKTLALLDRADAKVAAGDAEGAKALADEAWASFEAEKATVQGAARERVRARCTLALGETTHAHAGPTEALVRLALLEAGPDCGHIGRDRTERCEAFWSTLRTEFPRVVPRDSMARGFRITAHEIALLPGDINDATMRIIDNSLELSKHKTFALRVVPSHKVTSKTGELRARVEGSADSITSTKWKTVGKVEIGNETYDVKKRAGEETFHYRKANLLFVVPASDAALVRDEHMLTILVDRKQWKRTGDTWNAGTVRILRVRSLEDLRAAPWRQ